ncbi:MAG: hypothetical protein KJN97_04225 [Deltaproteobacteria bacterium]|nr:hypothetical protein [Deltaproteobacteria bacterium]
MATLLVALPGQFGLAHAGRAGTGKTKSKTSRASAVKASIRVYHASSARFSAKQLRINREGLVHVSTRASFSRQYGANLNAFKLRDKKLFRLETHEKLLRRELGQHRLSTAEGSLAINVHRDAKLHSVLKKLGFRGYQYKQWDSRRDRYIENYALFDTKLLKPEPLE